MRPWKRVAIVGVPGVGKTSLCNAVSLNSNYSHINYGELMLKTAQKRGLATNLPEMFRLDLSIQEDIWKTIALKIKDQKNVLLDLHGVDCFKEGYLISLPFEIMNPDLIIIIESDYEDIIKRRLTDSSKKRFKDRQSSLNEHVKMLRFAMINISACLGCNLAILDNSDFETCLKELKQILN